MRLNSAKNVRLKKRDDIRVDDVGKVETQEHGKNTKLYRTNVETRPEGAMMEKVTRVFGQDQ